MSKYELAISPDYVPNWTVTDAVRELFQNALDQETVDPENVRFFKYFTEQEQLVIGNKKATLSIQSLLLGSTSKNENSSTIGKFGEGYKIAALVLLRSGKTLTFYNYGAREVWKPRLVNSRRYGTQILTFFVEKQAIWKAVPDNNLTVVVDGITPDEYCQIMLSNLHLQSFTDWIETPKGRILLSEGHKGQVFVNGLYVCTYDKYHCGYDFKPEHIKLDRDRKLVSDFELRWLASYAWAEAGAEHAAQLASLAAKGAADVEYARSHHVYGDSGSNAVRDAVYHNFRNSYGEKAVPVSTQTELEAVPKNYQPVMVPDNYKALVVSSRRYTPPEPEPEEEKVKLSERFRLWFQKIEHLVALELSDEFMNLLTELEELE